MVSFVGIQGEHCQMSQRVEMKDLCYAYGVSPSLKVYTQE